MSKRKIGRVNVCFLSTSPTSRCLECTVDQRFRCAMSLSGNHAADGLCQASPFDALGA